MRTLRSPAIIGGLLAGLLGLSACAANPVRPATAPIDYRAGAPKSAPSRTAAKSAAKAPKPGGPAPVTHGAADATPPAAERPTASPAVAEAKALPAETGVRPGGPLRQRAALENRTVVVQPGDTVGSLARKLSLNRQALIDANRLEPPYSLKPGAKLYLPAPNIHIVQPGETLYSVSRRFNIDTRSLAVMNGLERPWRVWPGDELVLPLLATTDFGPQGAPPIPAVPSLAAAAGKSGPDTARPDAPKAASPSAPAGRPPADGFAWPASGPVVASFGPGPAGERNDGVDLALPPGATVKAAAAGEVVYAGEGVNGVGTLLLIQHPGGWITAYSQAERLLVAEGDSVTQGQPVAAASGGPDARLHFELRLGKDPVDPLQRLPRPG